MCSICGFLSAHGRMLSPNIISSTIQKSLPLHKHTSRSFHSRNIPRILSLLILLINASLGVSPHSRSRAPWIRLLYHSANAYSLSNLHLCRRYSWNHRSILLTYSSFADYSASRGCVLYHGILDTVQTDLRPASSFLRHLHRTECLDPY
jgi:hypothetical protein